MSLNEGGPTSGDANAHRSDARRRPTPVEEVSAEELTDDPTLDYAPVQGRRFRHGRAPNNIARPGLENLYVFVGVIVGVGGWLLALATHQYAALTVVGVIAGTAVAIWGRGFRVIGTGILAATLGFWLVRWALGSLFGRTWH